MRKIFLLLSLTVLFVGSISAQPWKDQLCVMGTSDNTEKSVADLKRQLSEFNGQPAKASQEAKMWKNPYVSKLFKTKSKSPNYQTGNNHLVYQGKAPSSNSNKATIVLMAADIWQNGSGHILLLAENLDFTKPVSIEEVFDASPYRIPENAIFDLSTPNVLDDIQTIEIPEGIYTAVVLNPDEEYGDFYTPTSGPSLMKNFNFKKGWVYLFEVENRDIILPNGTDVVDCVSVTASPPSSFAYSLPFFDDFTQSYPEQWLIIDANKDGITWDQVGEFSDGLGAMYFYHPSSDGDDYLMTNAPVALPAGKSYFKMSYQTASSPESFEIYYGKTNDVSQMEKIGGLKQIKASGWNDYIVPLDLAEAGNYYFAIRATSESDQIYLVISKIFIDEGIYVKKPMLGITSVFTPMDGCSVTSQSPIGLSIINSGDSIAYGYSVDYIIDGVAGSQTFSDTIGIKEIKTVYPDGPFDFNESGVHTIAWHVRIDGGRISNNNSATTSFIVTEPHKPPFINKLQNEAEAAFYHPETPSDWEYIPKTGYSSLNVDSPLYTDCIELGTGMYYLKIGYKAGLLVYAEDFEVRMGKSGTDVAGWEVVADLKDQISSDLIETEIPISISDPDTYRFAFISKKVIKLTLITFELKKLAEHDVAIEEFNCGYLAAIPLKQLLNGTLDFNITARNKGNWDETFKISLEQNETKIDSKDVTINAGEKETFVFSEQIRNIPLDTKELSFKATAILASDDELNDNSKTLSFSVGNTFATENAASASLFIGVDNSTTFALGNIYTLSVEDKLVSITSLLASANNLKGAKMEIGIYKIGEQFTDSSGYISYSLGEKLHTIPIVRPEGGLVTWTLETPIMLAPGSYYFEMRQVDPVSLKIAVDMSPTGSCYFTDNNAIMKVSSLGNVVLRANFDPYGTRVHSVENVDYNIYTNNNRLYVHAGQLINQIEVSDAQGRIVYQSLKELHTNDYVVNTAQWAKGVYVVRIVTDSEIKTMKIMK